MRFLLDTTTVIALISSLVEVHLEDSDEATTSALKEWIVATYEQNVFKRDQLLKQLLDEEAKCTLKRLRDRFLGEKGDLLMITKTTQTEVDSIVGKLAGER